jgi:heat shock protein HtpX
MPSGNGLKTVLLLGALSGLLLVIGDTFGGQQGLILALGMAVLMNGVSYFFSDKIALSMSGAQPVTREEAPKLYEVVERLCGKANLPMPKLYVIPEQAPNAFATGRSPAHASVAATVGLLELMNADELEGVIAHELSHVRNYDILTTSVAATLAAAITFLARMAGYAAMFGGMGRDDEDRRGGALSGLLMMILAPFAAALLQLALSRKREYAADESGARLVGHPYGLISALEKLGAYNKRIPMNTPQVATSLYIVAPLTAGEVFSALFSTHPPLEDRIETLRQMTITR